MLIAIEELLKKTKNINGSIMIILTSDEEGPAIHGIQSLVKEELKDAQIDYCLVGEPSCKENLGDTIKKVEFNEIDSKIVQRRSIRSKKDLLKGDLINYDDIEALRPCPSDALSPSQISAIIGKKLIRNLKKGDYFKKEDII